MNQTMSSDESLIKWRVANSNVERLSKLEQDYFRAIAQLEQNLKDWSGAKTLLEYLKNYKLEKRKDFILGVINSALKDIFESDYRLDILPRETKGKSAASIQKYDIIFYQNGIEIAKNDQLLTSNGGGVLSIASLFFKILIGYLYSKNKFYIFDEALSQVSPQYRVRLSRFLKAFCEKYGFTIVVVSQTEELEEHADLVYEVSADIDDNDIPIFKIDNVYGEEPAENYFYSQIENFQSIKKEFFKFKGFTIIRGPNNSGKSASLRAIESLLFNNFKTDIYPRKNPSGKKLTTSITFGYDNGASKKEIGLKYKSGKVMFVIEGEEYFGKSLAADKLKEAVEEIGFRYIDVKSMYKNFKGPLKEQTERIAYTNQYDGLFLIGSKASDSEKIFSFLFNTEHIALAIARAKEEMQEMAKNHKEIQEKIIEVQEELRKTKLQVDLYLKMYYAALIQEFNSIEINRVELNQKLKNIEKYLMLINNFVSVEANIDWLRKTEALISELKNKEEYNSIQLGLVTRVITLIDNINSIENFIYAVNTKQNYEKRNTLLSQLIPKLQNLVSLGYYFELEDNINKLGLQLNEWQRFRENLDHEYNLCECTTCQGIGVIPID